MLGDKQALHHQNVFVQGSHEEGENESDSLD